jgi:hypothetical protein
VASKKKVPGPDVPIIPDHVADALDRGVPGIPLEAMVSERALAAHEAEIRRRSEPVRMEGLRPGPHPAPVFEPGEVPPVPRVTRSIPAPFRRPVINLRVPGEAAPEWRYIRADAVREGDIVVDFGKVVTAVAYQARETVAGHAAVPVSDHIWLENPLGKTMLAGVSDQLRVFRVHENQEGSGAG